MDFNLKDFRFPGEFEKQQAVFMNWTDEAPDKEGLEIQDAFAEIIKALIGHVKVYVNVGIEGYRENCLSYLNKHEVNISDVNFVYYPDPIFYFRDQGPNIMVDKKGHLIEVNTNFNIYGHSNDQDPVAQGARKNAIHSAVEIGATGIVNTDVYTEGGNREYSGKGSMISCLSTELSRNPGKTKEELEAEYKRIFNLNRVIWIERPLFADDNIMRGVLDIVDGRPVFGSSTAGHTDEMCRFVDSNTILLAEVTEEEAEKYNSLRISKGILDKTYEMLKEIKDDDGNPYRIVRMPVADHVLVEYKNNERGYERLVKVATKGTGVMPDGTKVPEESVLICPAVSYCNFLIANDVVVGQKYYHEGMSESIREKDERARKILEECFPGRKVVMIDTLALNTKGGGVHCWTRNCAAAETE